MTDISRRIETATERYSNPWPAHYLDCLQSAKTDRPAFWTTCHAELATVMAIASHATRDGELHRSMQRLAGKDAAERIEILDHLVPLNHAAILQLRMAYQSLQITKSLASLYDRAEPEAVACQHSS